MLHTVILYKFLGKPLKIVSEISRSSSRGFHLPHAARIFTLVPSVSLDMAALSLRPNPLKWTGNYYNREAIWSTEPDIIVIRSLAIKHLAFELPNTADLDKLKVQFFAQGAFNKLYSISFPEHGTSYLVRVALPLVPYYRIESEAAMLSYLKENTSIPVSRVIAWESSAATDLGFEWILLEKIEGVALYDVWRGMPWDSKVRLVAALAPLLGQLRDHKFDEIGSLYFSGREEPTDLQYWSETALPTHEVLVDSAQNAPRSSQDEDSGQHKHQHSEFTVAVPPDVVALQHGLPPADGMGALSITTRTSGYSSRPKGLAERTQDLSTEASVQNRYVVGLLHDPLFYLYRRLYLPGNRGPFRNSRDWMAAELDFQRRWIGTAHTIKTSPYRKDFDVNDWSCDCEEEAPELEKLTLDFQGVLPEVFPDTDEAFPYILNHHDLSLASILVNPDTFEITGIIDWEKIQVVPEWKASRFPKFLKFQIDIEEIDDKEPRMPAPAKCEEDGESHDPVVVERRDRWDNKILRQHYDEALSRTRVEDHFSGYMRDSAKIKREFEEQVWDITEGARSARTWLEERSENQSAGVKIDQSTWTRPSTS